MTSTSDDARPAALQRPTPQRPTPQHPVPWSRFVALGASLSEGLWDIDPAAVHRPAGASMISP